MLETRQCLKREASVADENATVSLFRDRPVGSSTRAVELESRAKQARATADKADQLEREMSFGGLMAAGAGKVKGDGGFGLIISFCDLVFAPLGWIASEFARKNRLLAEKLENEAAAQRARDENAARDSAAQSERERLNAMQRLMQDKWDKAWQDHWNGQTDLSDKVKQERTDKFERYLRGKVTA